MKNDLNSVTMRWRFLWQACFAAIGFAFLQGCTSFNTFPAVARAGDTISVMVGGSEDARKETIAVTLTDANGGQWDLKALGRVRSVFNLRPDSRSEGMHYSPYLDSYLPWFFGHEPVQTVLVADLPTGVAPGAATLTVSLNATDNSSGVTDPFTVNLDIIAGTGRSEQFATTGAGGGMVDFSRLEAAPYAKIDFRPVGATIGAASLVVDFDETVVNPDDINVYVPESTVRGSIIAPGAFGATQRMVYWRVVNGTVHIDVISPQGIDPRFLQVFLIHPRSVTQSPNFTLVSSDMYAVDGSTIIADPSLRYKP